VVELNPAFLITITMPTINVHTDNAVFFSLLMTSYVIKFIKTILDGNLYWIYKSLNTLVDHILLYTIQNIVIHSIQKLKFNFFDYF
jgi:hypothetical protein